MLNRAESSLTGHFSPEEGMLRPLSLMSSDGKEVKLPSGGWRRQGAAGSLHFPQLA